MHEGTEIGLWGFYKKMVMIVHEHKGMKNSSVLVDRVGKVGEKFIVIHLREKDLLPLIPSGGNMIQSTGIHDTKRPGHRWLLWAGMKIA